MTCTVRGIWPGLKAGGETLILESSNAPQSLAQPMAALRWYSSPEVYSHLCKTELMI